MFHRKAVIGGLAGGAAAAILWAGVALMTSYEIGWIAWAVGGMVGFGVAAGNRGVDHAPVAAGMLAAAITLVAIPAGRYAALELSLPSDAALLETFLDGFGPMDVLFFGLAVVTAFAMAAGGRKSAEEVALEFEEALRLAMIKVMLADGRADAEEKRVVRDVCRSVAGVEIGEDELEREIALGMSDGRDISVMLGELAPFLNEHGRELITRSAFRVAAADGEFGPEERALISSVALSLGVTEEHLGRIIASPGEVAEPV